MTRPINPDGTARNEAVSQEKMDHAYKVIESREKRKKITQALAKIGAAAAGIVIFAGGVHQTVEHIASHEQVEENTSDDGKTVVREEATPFGIKIATKASVNEEGAPVIESVGISGVSQQALEGAGLALGTAAAIGVGIAAIRRRGDGEDSAAQQPPVAEMGQPPVSMTPPAFDDPFKNRT